MLPKPESALIIVGHGSTLNPDSSAPSFDRAEEIRSRHVFGEVHCCFWKEEPSFREVKHMVEREDVYIVPNFISEGYFTQTVIPRELQLDGPLTLRDGKKYKYCAPVGAHTSMTDVLLHRARETAAVPEEETTLFIVGHGTSLNDNSATAAKAQAAALRERTRYAAVVNAYMEEPPLISDWANLTATRYALVVPFFISDGLHSYQDIPVMLGMESEPGAAASEREVFRNNPYHVRDRTLFYASAIGTEPLIADVILEQVAAWDHEHGATS